MSTHAAVQMVAKGASLQSATVPTVQPEDGEVLVKVEWVASTPLDLHQNDGGLTSYPNIPVDSIAGVVEAVGPNVKNLVVGDKVFGFGWRSQKEKGAQEFVTFDQKLLGKIPEGVSFVEAVTLPNNFVTVFHSVTKDLGLSLPWPKPEGPPENADVPFLIWGASSSVGTYALQILSWYGYTNLIGTASKAHHTELRKIGARQVFDYRDPEITTHLLQAAGEHKPAIPFILDCIGSKNGSLALISKVAQTGSRVAVLLPVIVRDATVEQSPEYAPDPSKEADWESGVIVHGVRTHFYLENEFFAEHLQPEIMPYMLANGIVKPNRQRIVEGRTLLERAQRSLDMLRNKEVSGERLVWRVPNNS